MKQHKVPALIFVLLMLLSATAAIIGPSAGTASAATYGDFEYMFIDGANVKITGYNGPGGAVAIPPYIDDMVVAEIAEAAFQNEREITSVSIPDSVTTLGDGAFRGCTALQYVRISENVETIGSFTFYDNHALTSITIPSSVQTIKSLAFWNDHDLITIVFNGIAPSLGTNWIINPNSGLIAYYYPANAESFPSSLRGGVPTSQLGEGATAPNNLTAVSVDGQVTLTWDAPTNLGTAGIDQYVIYVDEVRRGTIQATNHPRFTVSGLENGTAYSFFVRALSGTINGQNSTVVAAIPLGVSIDYPSVNGAYHTSRSGTIEWGIEAINEVRTTEVSIDGGAWTEASGTSYEFTVASDGEHTAQVRVTSFVDNTETVARTFIVDTVAPTVVGKLPTGTDIAIESVVNVTFSEVMDATSVTIYVNGIDGEVTWSGNTATFTPDSLLAYDTQYTVAVNGKDLAGNSMESMWQFTTLKDEGTIVGVIRDIDGDPVDGAKVKLSNGMTATTDAEGYFILEHVPSGNYTLSAVKDGYTYMERYVNVTAGETADIGMLSLKASGGGSSWLIIAVVLIVATVAILIFALVRRDRMGGSGDTGGSEGAGRSTE